MLSVFIGAAHEIGDLQCRAVGDDREAKAHRAQRAGRASRRRLNLFRRRHLKRGGDLFQFFRLEFVEFVIPTQNQGNDFGFGASDQQRFQAAAGRYPEKLAYLLYAALLRGVDLAQGLRGCGSVAGRARGLRYRSRSAPTISSVCPPGTSVVRSV